jgi:hypothetical protein
VMIHNLVVADIRTVVENFSTSYLRQTTLEECPPYSRAPLVRQTPTSMGPKPALWTRPRTGALYYKFLGAPSVLFGAADCAV